MTIKIGDLLLIYRISNLKLVKKVMVMIVRVQKALNTPKNYPQNPWVFQIFEVYSANPVYGTKPVQVFDC